MKARVAKAAKAAGFNFEVDAQEVWLSAPKGYRFADWTYGERYSSWPIGRGGYCTKAEAYRMALWTIRTGLEPDTETET